MTRRYMKSDGIAPKETHIPWIKSWPEGTWSPMALPRRKIHTPYIHTWISESSINSWLPLLAICNAHSFGSILTYLHTFPYVMIKSFIWHTLRYLHIIHSHMQSFILGSWIHIYMWSYINSSNHASFIIIIHGHIGIDIYIYRHIYVRYYSLGIGS